MYKVVPGDPDFKSTGIVNPRRGAKVSAPLLGWRSYKQAKSELFSKFGLDDYKDCLTAEMASRPIPHVFKVSETASLTALYERRMPAIMRVIMSNIVPPIQPLNKESRVGWPWFDRPWSKRALLLPFFEKLQGGQLADLMAEEGGCYTIMNVRLQPESLKKEREMMFISPAGKVYLKKVTAEDRALKSDYGVDYAARTRLVFNLPWPNLYKQVLDTAIHNFLLQHPVFHHNLYSPTGHRPLGKYQLALDVRHFERHTATLARARAKLIGGEYGRIGQIFADAPFLVPSDDWKKCFYISVDRASGFSEQFASGDSAVAPVQKEVFLCLYTEYAESHLGVSPSESLAWVLRGGDDRLTIHNYGDDNVLSGDEGAVKACFQFLESYLHVEEEEPAKFLGFHLTPEGFRLDKSSYLLKTWLNEREPFSRFRRYPLFGWVEKRKVYAKYGKHDISTDVFPTENAILAKLGVPWHDIEMEAHLEQMRLTSRGAAYRNPAWLLGKDYAMTAEEKIATGLYEGLYPSETAPIVRHLVGSEWHNHLR